MLKTHSLQDVCLFIKQISSDFHNSNLFSEHLGTQQTFPYRADIGAMSEYRCRFPISGRHRADIYNCTVKYFFQLLSIQ